MYKDIKSRLHCLENVASVQNVDDMEVMSPFFIEDGKFMISGTENSYIVNSKSLDKFINEHFEYSDRALNIKGAFRFIGMRPIKTDSIFDPYLMDSEEAKDLVDMLINIFNIGRIGIIMDTLRIYDPTKEGTEAFTTMIDSELKFHTKGHLVAFYNMLSSSLNNIVDEQKTHTGKPVDSWSYYIVLSQLFSALSMGVDIFECTLTIHTDGGDVNGSSLDSIDYLHDVFGIDARVQSFVLEKAVYEVTDVMSGITINKLNEKEEGVEK